MFPAESYRLPRRWREILASAYELSEDEVAEDAAHILGWSGSDEDLILSLETHHGWSMDSKLGPYYLVDVRGALG